ncbi:heterokaryon incompatibility protein-domain-containing protein [Pestalotiopsis sp. NC0098]|nr:heterokaryon incompatibility protein-domain-containing protein [Pestalotiopsis sp. NC0098]
MKNLCPHCDAGRQHHMTYDSRIQQIQDWLTKCLDTHQACTWENPLPSLPTRVLHLDLGDGSDDVRLVDGKGRQGIYAALTYCWGLNPDTILKTNSTNIRQNQSRIVFADLNLLFREVVKILRSLRVDYLWIDAICIVQDIKTDWDSEASNMAAIYSNAYLTMSASEATSPDDYRTPQSPVGTSLLSSPRGLEHVITHGTLAKRGWCLQERCLSRRIVHLGSNQLHWECPGATHDEHVVNRYHLENAIGPDQRIMLGPKGFLNDSLPGHGTDPYGLWYMILRSYGDRSLSFEKDRLPALYGLIDLFKKATGDSMIAGLWRADIPRGLTWNPRATVEHDYDTKAYAPEMLPSWSWFRAHGLVGFTQPNRRGAPSIQILSLEESDMTITMQGTLFNLPPAFFLGSISKFTCGSYEITNISIDWDFRPESIARFMARGLEYSSLRNNAEASAAIRVLVVIEPLKNTYAGLGLVIVWENQSKTYRRVGLVTLFTLGWLKHFDEGVHQSQQPWIQTIKLQ